VRGELVPRDVVGKHAELDDAHAEAPACSPEDGEDARERVGVAQAGDAVDEANGDVLRMRALGLGPPHVRHASSRPARFSSGTFASATPCAQLQLDLNGSLARASCHRDERLA
jgi:hypothetical protein